MNEPGLLLERINALVHDDVQGSRFVTLALGPETDRFLSTSPSRGLIYSQLSRASGVVTDSTALIAVLSKAGFRKERMILASAQPVAAEACHRLLLPTRG
jgi:predicted transcriptional regulator